MSLVALPDPPRPLRIAHLSDLHVLDLAGTKWYRFLNKRATGAVNLAGVRRNAHPTAVAEQLADRMRAGDIDHVILTGDLTNLALESEFAAARRIVERIGPPSFVTLIPGNHDLYTRGSLRHHRFERTFSDYLVDEGDDHHSALTRGRLHYPFVRTPAPHVRIYGLSSAIPTPPLLAFGHVGKAQLQRLRELVAREPDDVHVRIMLVHHNLHHRVGIADHVASLFDREAFTAAMHELRATAVLHGHTHHPHQGHLQERRGAESLAIAVSADQASAQDIPVLGCGSSTWSKRRSGDRARFNVLEIGPTGLQRVQSYLLDPARGEFLPEHDDLLDKALAKAIVL